MRRGPERSQNGRVSSHWLDHSFRLVVREDGQTNTIQDADGEKYGRHEHLRGRIRVDPTGLDIHHVGTADA